ncbi:MAG: tyrosine-type recombinase/integrase family protein, partial [Lachnospiraceae bacterium]|nr:tyrosine-type recombinase/integrase family protein [Lachnospiraceae bacterium]
EVLLQKKQAEAILKAESFVAPSQITVGEFLDVYIEDYVRGITKPSTERVYTYLVVYIKPYLGNIKLQQLRSVDLQRMYKQMLTKSPVSDKPLALRTVTDIKHFCSVWLNVAVSTGYIEKNPNLGVKLPKQVATCVQKKKAVYTLEEVKTLLQGVKGSDFELPLTLLLDSGCRRGELMAFTYVLSSKLNDAQR